MSRPKFLVFVFLISIALHPVFSREEVTLLAGTFSDDAIGKCVGTLMDLKIWRRVSLPPSEDSSGRDSLPVKVEWSSDPFTDPSFASAEHVARQKGARLVLWGSIVHFGDAILAQPYLSILPQSEVGENAELTWTVPNANPELNLSVTLPTLRYRLPPIVLGNVPCNEYADPSEVRVYRGQAAAPPLADLGLPIGKLGNSYTALANQNDFTQVLNADKQKGWIYLPKLAGEDETVALVVGVLHLLSRDYTGAIKSLNQISGSSVARIELKVDALLLQALATAKLQGDPTPLIQSAKKLNPYLQTTIKFEIANLVSRIQSGPTTERESALATLNAVLSETSYMFSEGDPWKHTGRAILASLESRGQKRMRTVALTVGDLGNPFFVQIAHGAQDAARKINPSVKFSVESSNYDVTNQTNQMDNFVSSGVSLILLNAADSKGIAPAVMRAKAAGVIVVAVDVGAEGGVDATVTSNNKQAGELDGKYVADRLKGKGQIVIVNGPPVTAVTDRVAGFTEEIKKYPDIKIVSQEQNAGGSRDGGLRVMTDLLTAFKKIDAVFAINDPTAIGCDLAAKQAQRKDFFIVGVDGAPDVVPSLKDKDSLIAASAAQDPYTMAGKAVQIGYNILAGKKPEQELTLVPVQLITKENVELYKGWTR